MELIHLRVLSRPRSCPAPTTSAGRLPQPLGCPAWPLPRGHAAFAALAVIRDRPTTGDASLPLSPLAYRVAYPRCHAGNAASSPGVMSGSSVPCRPQTPWCGGWIRTPSPPQCGLDLVPPWADRFILASLPRLRPGTSPQAFRTPPRGGRPALRLPSLASCRDRDLPLAVSAVSGFVPV